MTLNSRRSIFSSEDIERFRRTCEAIAESCADDSGFVPVGSLLRRFQARLICRPLLVEGMFGSIESSLSAESREWVVLVNSKKYPVTESDVMGETSGRPLDARLRFTIAHELAHSLAFRATDFGVQLRAATSDQRDSAELVAALEADADSLASALLCAPSVIRDFFKRQGLSADIGDFSQLRRRLGVSRPVLINRLRQLASVSELSLRQMKSLLNTAIGLGTWTANGQAVLRNWPVFANFDHNLLPKVLLDLVHHDRLPAIDAFPDSEFSLCGGDRRTSEFLMKVGTPNTLTDESISLVCAFEETSRDEEANFLWMLSGKSRPS